MLMDINIKQDKRFNETGLCVNVGTVSDLMLRAHFQDLNLDTEAIVALWTKDEKGPSLVAQDLIAPRTLSAETIFAETFVQKYHTETETETSKDNPVDAEETQEAADGPDAQSGVPSNIEVVEK